MTFNLEKHMQNVPWNWATKIISNLKEEDRIQTSKTWSKKNVYKKEIGKMDKVIVYLVNGGEIKTKIDMDFVEGCNDMAKDYIPENEIWLDAHIDKNELKFILYHEFIERMIMEQKNMDYEDAHGIANKKEKAVRTYENI